MNFAPLFILLFLVSLTAYGQQERVAIINTLDDYDSISVAELTYLTNKLRETAVKILPKDRFGVMTTESIVAFLGSHERLIKVCKESSCLADLGRQVSADYVAQGRIGRFSNNLTIMVELYSVKSGVLMDSFTGHSKDIFGFLALLDEKAPIMFKNMLATAPPPKNVPPIEPEIPIFKDFRDNKTYKIVKIGTQTWMAENLNYNASGSKCYDNKSANCDKYGRLYNWETAKKVCPVGWHLPSNADWNVLMKFVNPSCSDKSKCAGTGKSLKAKSGWNDDGNGTDKFGFSALPGGYGSSSGSFYDVGYFGHWWSSSEDDAYDACYRYMVYNLEYVLYGYSDKGHLQSVRCLQD